MVARIHTKLKGVCGRDVPARRETRKLRPLHLHSSPLHDCESETPIERDARESPPPPSLPAPAKLRGVKCKVYFKAILKEGPRPAGLVDFTDFAIHSGVRPTPSCNGITHLNYGGRGSRAHWTRTRQSADCACGAVALAVPRGRYTQAVAYYSVI